MKIAKAPKLKNQLAGETARLKRLLAEQNVRSTKQKFDYDNRQGLDLLRAKLDELVKAAVAAANAEIHDLGTGWCRQSARPAEAREVPAQFRLQWPGSSARCWG